MEIFTNTCKKCSSENTFLIDNTCNSCLNNKENFIPIIPKASSRPDRNISATKFETLKSNSNGQSFTALHNVIETVFNMAKKNTEDTEDIEDTKSIEKYKVSTISVPSNNYHLKAISDMLRIIKDQEDKEYKVDKLDKQKY